MLMCHIDDVILETKGGIHYKSEAFRCKKHFRTFSMKRKDNQRTCLTMLDILEGIPSALRGRANIYYKRYSRRTL